MMIVQGSIQFVLFGFLLYVGKYNRASGTDICPVDYVMHNSYCYHFSDTVESWSAANKLCRSHGSSLSSISDLEEANFLYQLNKSAEFSLDSFRDNQWIGFHQTDMSVIKNNRAKIRRRGWAWIDGSDVTWSNWRSNEPSKRETCARLYQNKELAGINCTYPYYFICKQVTISTTTSTTVTTPSTTSTTTTPTTTPTTTEFAKATTTTSQTTTMKAPVTTEIVTPTTHISTDETATTIRKAFMTTEKTYMTTDTDTTSQDGIVVSITSDNMEYTTKDTPSEATEDGDEEQMKEILMIVLIVISVLAAVVLTAVIILAVKICRMNE